MDAGTTAVLFNADAITTCGGVAIDDDLWTDPIPYVPGGLIALGMDAGVPDYVDVKSGEATHETLPANAPALAELFPWTLKRAAEGGEAAVDGRADVYAFGLVLYEMLAGVLPLVAVFFLMMYKPGIGPVAEWFG